MKRILVIEDNSEVRENLAEILELTDYDVITAENGKVGVEKALNENPDLILCDVMMPVLDGYGVLRILERKPATSDIPFIFLTAKAEKADFRKGMNLGADDYLTKPFDDVELLDAIDMRIRKHDRIKKAFDGTQKGLKAFFNEARAQKDLESLSKDRTIKYLQKKEYLYKEDTPPKSLFFLAKGKIKTFKTNDLGKELITHIYKPGEFIGAHTLLLCDLHQESAMAMEDTEVSLIPKEDFFSLLYHNRNFSSIFLKILANNIEKKEEELLSLAYNSIRKRVAQALIKLNERYQSDGRTEIRILRDDLASFVGTAKESVIRTLTDLKKEGFISIDNSMITILNLKALQDLPN